MPDNAVKHKKMSFVIVERLIGMISSGELTLAKSRMASRMSPSSTPNAAPPLW